MTTYQATIKGKTITLSMLKGDAARTAGLLRRACVDLPHYWKEITGTIGGEKHETVLSALVGNGAGQMKDPDAWNAAADSLLASLPPVVTIADEPRIRTECVRIATEFLPVQDLRKTSDEQAERAQKLAAMEAERKAAEYAWIDANCRDREKVAIPDGKMAVYLEVNYNNSDSMTDYFDSNCAHGKKMLLLIADKGRNSEALARRALALYPELAALSWTWHKENYSMGHGYWLESNVFGTLPEVRTYGGVTGPACWYEISFTSYDAEMYAYKNYPGKAASVPAAKIPRPDRPAPDQNPENSPQDGPGYEIIPACMVKFPSRPPRAILDRLSDAGGVWDHNRMAWSFDHILTTEDVAAMVNGVAKKEAGPAESPAPRPFPDGAAIATRLRTLADGMTKEIDSKFNPGIASQNYTARRARIADGMREEGYALQAIQKALYALADGHEAGNIPADLATLTTKKAVSEAVYRKLPALIEYTQPADHTADRKRIELMRRERELVGQIPGYFPTPPDLADKMVQLAQLGPEDVILEPSAGAGAIVDRLPEGSTVNTIEYNCTLAAILKEKGHAPISDDFLTFTNPEGIQWTRILMNPPFEHLQDIDHVRHAYDLLENGGRLVAIMSESPFFRSDIKAAEFRSWLDDVAGYDEKLPPETFKPSGTNVAARMVVINK